MADKNQPIIIKKIKKGGGHGHHGGSWKIAYADFVTAMMAFFLLMWLLNATSEEQKRGIANYFDPVSVGSQGGGNWGVMGGLAIAEKNGSMSSSSAAIEVKPQSTREKGLGTPTAPEEQKSDKTHIPIPQQFTSEVSSPKKQIVEQNNELAEANLEKDEVPIEQPKDQTQDDEKKSFAEIKEQLTQSIQNDPSLKDLFNNLIIDETEEGLRIQIIDRDKRPMFPNGSSRMYQPMQDLLTKVAVAIAKVPNCLSISGHTDATPYAKDRVFSNWELSSERANASRRVLREHGIEDARFQSIVGRADKELFNKANPESEENRRISIVLLRQKK